MVQVCNTLLPWELGGGVKVSPILTSRPGCGREEGPNHGLYLNLALWELARDSGVLGTVQEFGGLGGLCLQVGPPP